MKHTTRTRSGSSWPARQPLMAFIISVPPLPCRLSRNCQGLLAVLGRVGHRLLEAVARAAGEGHQVEGVLLVQPLDAQPHGLLGRLDRESPSSSRWSRSRRTAPWARSACVRTRLGGWRTSVKNLPRLSVCVSTVSAISSRGRLVDQHEVLVGDGLLLLAA